MISFSLSAQKMGKLKDKRDGKIYPTVVIGSQTWMAENLNASTFRNGDPIPEVKSKEEWEKAVNEKRPAWCYYENRSIQNDPSNGNKYGKLYNWYAVNDTRGIAPVGWHIPSDDEWTILINAQGGEASAGVKLKTSSSWIKNGNGNNWSGFSGLPGGYRFNDGTFLYFGEYGMWWSSTETNNSWNAWYRLLDYKNNEVLRSESNKEKGLSVRCIKD